MKKSLLFLFGLIITIFTFGQQIHSFITKDGETLYYETVGKGPKVILLQGGPGYGVNGLNPWADSLSADHECILFHQRGTGLSSNVRLDSTTINLERAVQDLNDLRVHFGQEKLILCGQSWGGMLAEAYASFFPNNTEKIVLVSTCGPDMSLFPATWNNLSMRRYPTERDSLKYWNNQPFSDIAIFKQGFFIFLPYFYDHNIGIREWPQTMKLSPFNKQMSDLMWKDLNKNYNLNSTLSNYKNICIIIRPRQDIVPAEAIYQIKEILPQARIFTIERCGHFPHLEQPKMFYKILREVL